jgi:hypothetical protein
MKKLGLRIYDAYQYIFDSTKNPIRHIPDPVSRMFIMNILALMLLMFFFTVAIFYDAEKNQSSWLLKLRRKHG